MGGPSSSLPLCVPVALSKLGAVVGDAGAVALHVDVRAPVSVPVAAPPAERGLCFMMVMEEWCVGRVAVAAVANDGS